MRQIRHPTRLGISMPRIWFADRPAPLRALSLATYRGGPDVGRVPGFSRDIGHTLLVDITVPEEALLGSFRRNMRREIRHAIDSGVRTRFVNDPDSFGRFVAFYNAFAARKGIPAERPEHLVAYRPHGVVGQALLGDTVLAQKLFLVDPDARRVRILRGASLLSGEPGARVVGRANRLLYHAAMCHFRRQGFRTFDMGGYAEGTTDEALSRINAFKAGFGGTVVAEATYHSYPVAAYHWLRRVLRPAKPSRQPNAAATPAEELPS